MTAESHDSQNHKSITISSPKQITLLDIPCKDVLVKKVAKADSSPHPPLYTFNPLFGEQQILKSRTVITVVPCW